MISLLLLFALAYNPLLAPEGSARVYDTAVKGEREIPLRVYLPSGSARAPVVLFSHGLGGSREANAYLGRHWAGRGYLVVFLQHPGSDDSVWRQAPLGQKMAAMRKAASFENLRLRVQDVKTVLDQLERWDRTAGHPLAGRMDTSRVGMSGHSFGALTTQWVSGQQAAGVSITDSRIKAAIAMSPSAPSVGDPKRAFGEVKVPWLLMTGTEDTAPIGGSTVADRLAVFPALPPGGKYELVLAGGQHSAFSERALPGARRNPNHHRAILALSTAFWDAYLRDDQAARAWLEGQGATAVLEEEDTWRSK